MLRWGRGPLGAGAVPAGPPGPSDAAMSNELLLAVAAVAVVVGIYLLRHVIALAFRLVVLAALVLAGYWAWQNRAELVDAAEPWLGGLGDRIRELNLPDVPGLLDLRDSSEDAPAPADAGGIEDPGAAPDGEVLREAGDPERSAP